jgi:hypothetical protein
MVLRLRLNQRLAPDNIVEFRAGYLEDDVVCNMAFWAGRRGSAYARLMLMAFEWQNKYADGDRKDLDDR